VQFSLIQLKLKHGKKIQAIEFWYQSKRFTRDDVRAEVHNVIPDLKRHRYFVDIFTQQYRHLSSTDEWTGQLFVSLCILPMKLL